MEQKSDEEPLARAARIIESIVEARENVSPFSMAIEREWGSASDEKIDAAVRERRMPLHEQVQLLFLHSQRLALDAAERYDPSLLHQSLIRLTRAGAYIARAKKNLPPDLRKAALSFAAFCADGIRVPHALREEVRRENARIVEAPDWAALFGEGWNEGTVSEKLKEVRKVAIEKNPVLLPKGELPDSNESAADILAAAAGRQEREAIEASGEVDYDRSDAEVRLRSVQLSGLRGAPGKLKLTFGKKNSPSSVLIFGENGTGKSTIVDAIEFALQGRIGRSAHYDSPVAPSLRSFSATGESRARVDLTDDSWVERSAVVDSHKKVIAEPRNVRPGFRLAPITIKRTDLSNFLDTEALSRGTVLLDYFPADSDSLAVRPSEKARLLQTEVTELRIKRTAYAGRLAGLLGVDPVDLANNSGFNNAIREKIYRGKNAAAFAEEGGWQHVDVELCQLVQQLGSVFAQLGKAKQFIENSDNSLNPVLHRKQTLLLKSALQDVGLEVTAAFRRICHEHPVERIDIVLGESGPLSLDVVVRLKGGRNCFPQQLFSEAYRDLLALLFFVAVARRAAERGQAKVLILDDVLQSVDSTVRHAFVEHLLEELSEWQLIFTVHDRFWLERLRSLFNSARHVFIEHQIRRWDPDEGPELQSPGVDALTKDLKLLLEHGEPDSVAGKAGPLLEYVCRELCARLRLPIPYNRERVFTLHDLWGSVSTSLSSTHLAPTLRKIDSVRGMRNPVAHGDPRALELSNAEARSFGDAVLELYEGVRCSSCKRWANEGGPCSHNQCVIDIQVIHK
ncbi:AAA family ATPase [Streptomyces sp. f51]|uniref:AAA family ATPase n=1 Tax=Streptomyces sp. f51 TaxID=1827742 RepID=UPI0030CC183D